MYTPAQSWNSVDKLFRFDERRAASQIYNMVKILFDIKKLIFYVR